MITTTEQRTTAAEAERHLEELLEQRARIATASRYDADLRAEVADIDTEIAAAKRVLAEFCSECGHRVLRVNGAEFCCWNPCTRYGHPIPDGSTYQP